jgi:putative membrane protein
VSAGLRARARPERRDDHRVALLAIVLGVLVWSGIRPHDRFTWFLEVAPVLLGLPILVATRRRFPLTPLAYLLLALHAIILMVGGKYTYAEVPLGFWLEDAFGFARNHYDRIGHFAQGFVPAVVAREVLVRRSPLRGSRWLPYVAIAFCLAFSAFYELLEFWTALGTGEAAEAFLGTQGDVWDTQWDMMMALIGAVAALIMLSRVHDRQLGRFAAVSNPAPSTTYGGGA